MRGCCRISVCRKGKETLVHLDLNNVQSLPYFAAEIVMFTTIVLLLLADLLLGISERLRYTSTLAMLGILVGLAICWTNIGVDVAHLFNRMVAFDPFANFFKIIILLATLGVVFISRQ